MVEVVTKYRSVLYSYDTPVAYYEGRLKQYYRTTKFWSATTTKHINRYLAGDEAEVVDQKIIDYMAGFQANEHKLD